MLPLLVMPPSKRVITPAPTSMPNRVALIVPLLMMPPLKLVTGVSPFAIPATKMPAPFALIEEIVPLLVMPPVKVETPATPIPGATSGPGVETTVMVPPLAMPPEKFDTNCRLMPVVLPWTVPLLTMPPLKVGS